jgi:hypothetical protein
MKLKLNVLILILCLLFINCPYLVSLGIKNMTLIANKNDHPPSGGLCILRFGVTERQTAESMQY